MALYANQWGPEGIEYPDRSHAVLIPIEVRVKLTNTLATLYADKDKLAAAANPVMTDSLGNLTFWADPGEYLLKIGIFTIPITIGEHPLEPDSGGGGGGQYLQHIQATPQGAFPVVHNFGRYPTVQILSSDRSERYEGWNVSHDSLNQITVSMDDPTPVVVVMVA